MPVLTSARVRRAALVLLLLPAAGMGLGAETAVSREYQIKAAFLFNFTQFVKWPAAALGGAKQPFLIGILGADPFDGFLDETVAGEEVEGHPLAVRRCGSVREARDCRVLFISRSEKGRLADILRGLKGRSVLTVGDSRDFARRGGIIRFVTEEDRIHFRINLRAARGAGLTISSQVLRLAEIVAPGKD